MTAQCPAAGILELEGVPAAFSLAHGALLILPVAALVQEDRLRDTYHGFHRLELAFEVSS